MSNFDEQFDRLQEGAAVSVLYITGYPVKDFSTEDLILMAEFYGAQDKQIPVDVIYETVDRGLVVGLILDDEEE